MATLCRAKIEPFKKISNRAVSPALCKALHFIFQNTIEGVWFVGGSALAGYYAEHRRSDDIDLFVATDKAHESAKRAVRALKKKGATISSESTSPIFYSAEITFLKYAFTIAIVLDENLHRHGRAVHTEDGMWVADFETLLAMKIACLVSRCSEKDLFDLDWMFGKMAEMPTAADMILRGQQVDGGLNVETLLLSLQGAILRKDACHFLLPDSRLTVHEAYQRIVNLKERLIAIFMDYERKMQPSDEVKALRDTVRDIKRFRKKV